MNYYNVYIILFLFSHYCCKGINKESIPEDRNEIVLIFCPRTFESDTIYYEGGAKSFNSSPNINYSFENSFLKIPIFPKKDMDTVLIKSKSAIILSHKYFVNYESSYIFEPGDTITFSYEKNYPILKTNNSNYSDIDLNFITRYNYNNFYSILPKKLFFKLSKEEKENISKQKILYNKKLLKSIDSLYEEGSMNKRYYNLLINKYKPKDYNKLPEKIYMNNYNLSLPYNRMFLLNVFNKDKNIVNIKTQNGFIVNSKAKFDKVLEIDSITPDNRDFLLFTFLEGIAADFSKSDFNNYFEKFKIEISDKELISYIENKYLTDYGMIKDESSLVNLLDSKKSELTLQKFIENNKGKVIYVDFWASWCMPCIEAMPASHQLQKKYKDKNFVFLYLSIDKDFEVWQKANARLDLGEEKSFLVLNAENSDFMKELNVSTIPRYIIYDETGKLVHQNAPGPGAENIEEVLDGDLKK